MRCALLRQFVLTTAVCLFVLATMSTSRADLIDPTHLGPSIESIHFFGNGKGPNTVDLLFASCNHQRGSCSMSGTTMGPANHRDRYAVIINSPIALTPKNSSDWAASTLPGSVSFCYGQICDLLSGTLVLLQFKDSGRSGSLTFAFKATGGSLENLFTHSHGDFVLALNSPYGLNAAALVGTSAHVSETFTGGILTPVPEPTSFVLVGSGLLGLAGRIRQKLAS